MDRTPADMLEDSSMWSRAGYPAVAVGRYRDAADQIKRLNTRVAELEVLLDQANRHKQGRGIYLEEARARIDELERRHPDWIKGFNPSGDEER